MVPLEALRAAGLGDALDAAIEEGRDLTVADVLGVCPRLSAGSTGRRPCPAG